MARNVSHEKYANKRIYAHMQRTALTVTIFRGTHNRPLTLFDIRYIDNYRKQQKHIGKQVKVNLNFELSPCSECRMLSFGRFPGVCSLNTNVSEHSVCSIFI